MTAKISSYRPWDKVKILVHIVQKHICGHVSYTDLKSMLKRNNVWSDNVINDVANIDQTLTLFTTSSQPQ